MFSPRSVRPSTGEYGFESAIAQLQDDSLRTQGTLRAGPMHESRGALSREAFTRPNQEATEGSLRLRSVSIEYRRPFT